MCLRSSQVLKFVTASGSNETSTQEQAGGGIVLPEEEEGNDASGSNALLPRGEDGVLDSSETLPEEDEEEEGNDASGSNETSTQEQAGGIVLPPDPFGGVVIPEDEVGEIGYSTRELHCYSSTRVYLVRVIQ